MMAGRSHVLGHAGITMVELLAALAIGAVIVTGERCVGPRQCPVLNYPARMEGLGGCTIVTKHLRCSGE